MRYCDECKTESLTPGCPYCMTYKSKEIIKVKKNTMKVLALNFYNEIKENNLKLSENFINIKDLETNN